MQLDINKLPKKHQSFVKDFYKEGQRYAAVIKFEDGFTRSLGAYSLSEIKYYIKEVVENNRFYEE